MSCPLDRLDDSAAIRVFPAHPALSADAARALVAGIDRLFAAFAKEGRLLDHAAAAVHDGRFVIAAWISGGTHHEGISGCSHDKLARLVAEHEQRSGSALLDPPPIGLDLADGYLRCQPAEFRRRAAAGLIDTSAMAWDHLLTNLGEWRRRGRRPIADHWLAPVLQRARATAPTAP
jgi:hypothetical protein